MIVKRVDIIIVSYIMCKGKSVPLQAWTVLEGSEEI